MKFREDINGLRAIAVIAVVIFHFSPDFLPGGFAGVDVFFVISGYLMTSIIISKLENNNFSITSFYIARANRIIPALAVLCLVILAFGWFYITPLDYKVIAKHALASIGFISNIIYWNESGYFDTESLEKWLLHTWSLSVEWQFYIVYPIILVILRKIFSLKLLKKIIVFLTLLGFLFSVYATEKWPEGSYYLLPTRAWEMMVGGIAYIYPISIKQVHKAILEWSGLLLIFVSYVYISSENYWPGYLAMIPVFATFLIIQAHQNNGAITSNKILQKIGSWSYSIYLWHWPIVVYMNYYSINDRYIYLGMALSILLGAISYEYVEKNNFNISVFRKSKLLKNTYLNYLGITALTCAFVIITDGYISRLSDSNRLKYLSAKEAIGDWAYPEANLKMNDFKIRLIKGTTDKNILFIGASHIEQTYPYVELLDSEYNIYYLTHGGCFVSPSFDARIHSCSNIQRYKEILDEIKFNKVVSSIYSLNSYLSRNPVTRKKQIDKRVTEYDEFLKYAKSKADKVYLLLGEPKGKEFDPASSVRLNLNNWISEEQARKEYKIHYNAISQLKSLDGITIIDPIDYLCSDGKCYVMDENYNYFYKDAHHMRPWYAKKVLGYLEPIFSRP